MVFNNACSDVSVFIAEKDGEIFVDSDDCMFAAILDDAIQIRRVPLGNYKPKANTMMAALAAVL